MKRFLQDQPIAAKVALAPAVVLLCLLLLVLIGSVVYQSSAAALQRLSSESLPEVVAAEQLKARSARLDGMVMRSLAYEGSGMKAKRIEQLDRAILDEFTAFAADLAKKKAAAPDDERALYDKIEQILARFRRMASETIEMKSGGLSAAAMMMTSAESEYRDFEKAVDTLVAAVDARARASAAASIAQMEHARVVSLVMAACAVLLSVGVSWACVRLITRPLHAAVRIAREVAEGNLAVAVRTERRDETGQVLAALAQVSQRLGAVMGQVQQAAHAVEAASGEIASANGDLSMRTEQSAASLQVTAQTLSELAGQMDENGRSAAQACRMASETADVARRGGDAVNDVVATMAKINAQAQRIRDIIGVIDGIAFQTNILALNAAVEAARAGEQGRGFAVVAQEVRALASRSAASAREIRTLISTSVEQVEGGSAQVQAASSTIGEVVHSVHEILRIVSEMAQAGGDQARGVAEVNEAVASMDHTTQQNAAMVEQAAAATRSLKEQAETLMESLAVFRLERAASA